MKERNTKKKDKRKREVSWSDFVVKNGKTW
jgi:hypothetical protein